MQHYRQSATNTETNQLIYITAAVTVKMLGYEVNSKKEHALHAEGD